MTVPSREQAPRAAAVSWPRPPGRVLVGLLLVVLGLFLLDQAGMIDAARIIGTWWPLIIIALGLYQLAEQPHSPIDSLIVVDR